MDEYCYGTGKTCNLHEIVNPMPVNTFMASKIYFTVKKVIRDRRKILRHKTKNPVP
jgi:hypothetical protein